MLISKESMDYLREVKLVQGIVIYSLKGVEKIQVPRMENSVSTKKSAEARKFQSDCSEKIRERICRESKRIISPWDC